MGGIVRLLERKTTLSDSEKQFIINAVKLQELVKEWELELVTAPLDEQPVKWLDHEISQYLADLIKKSEKFKESKK